MISPDITLMDIPHRVLMLILNLRDSYKKESEVYRNRLHRLGYTDKEIQHLVAIVGDGDYN